MPAVGNALLLPAPTSRALVPLLSQTEQHFLHTGKGRTRSRHTIRSPLSCTATLPACLPMADLVARS